MVWGQGELAGAEVLFGLDRLDVELVVWGRVWVWQGAARVEEVVSAEFVPVGEAVGPWTYHSRTQAALKIVF